MARKRCRQGACALGTFFDAVASQWNALPAILSVRHRTTTARPRRGGPGGAGEVPRRVDQGEAGYCSSRRPSDYRTASPMVGSRHRPSRMLLDVRLHRPLRVWAGVRGRSSGGRASWPGGFVDESSPITREATRSTVADLPFALPSAGRAPVHVRFASGATRGAANSLDTVSPPFLACTGHNTTTRTDWR